MRNASAQVPPWSCSGWSRARHSPDPAGEAVRPCTLHGSVMGPLRVAVVCLSVLPTAAAAVEGTYRNVGPRQRHPLHARPVPAWGMTANVRRAGPSRYAVQMFTARPGGCTGEVTAIGTLRGSSMTAVSDSAECKLAITFKGSVMNVREESLCTSFRGMACEFGGSLARVSVGQK